MKDWPERICSALASTLADQISDHSPFCTYGCLHNKSERREVLRVRLMIP
jgi:hypothetical protein